MRYLSGGAQGTVYISAGELTGNTLPAVVSAVTMRKLAGTGRAKPGVRLSHTAETGGLCFNVYGSADAVIYPSDGENTLPILIELREAGNDKKSPSPRATVLAALLSGSTGGCSVVIRTIFTSPGYSSVTGSREHTVTAESLEGSLKGFLTPFIERAAFEKNRSQELFPALKKLKFPHSSFRDGQKTLIDETYTALKNGERLFAEAPTGIGKTVSVLYGAMRAINEKSFRRVFYLTAKASTAREAFAAAGKLFAAGSPARTCVIAAKEQVCPYAKNKKSNEFVCDPQNCPLMKNYPAASREATGTLLKKWKGYSVGAISAAAEYFGVCPYELSLDLSERCDVIICDYNYAFSPAVRLRRYFDSESEDGFVFLVDEAHNLTERARGIYSAVLTAGCTAGVRETLAEGADLLYSLDALENALSMTAELCRDTIVKDENGLESGYYFSSSPLKEIDDAVSVLSEALSARVMTVRKTDPSAAAAAAALLRRCNAWISASGCYGPEYRTYISIDKGRLTAELFCLDPSERLGEVLSRAHASVFFSATLTPSEYFTDVLGGGKGYGISLPSPFPRSNLFVAAFTGADTRWEARDSSVKKIAAVIASTCAAKPGNYLVFFPSYRYLNAVSEVFTARYPGVRVKLQTPGMSRGDKEEFISFFADDAGILRIGFCVLGGSFSEGIDLPGKRLIGTVIVGTGLPGLSAERNIIKEYYDVRSECGYDYAYTYPGMNNILQAAGRVIRRDTDRGCVILIDQRYSEERYKQLMPPHWKGLKYYGDAASLRDGLKEFWSK